jgi:putative ABC transport system permease protein
MPRPEHWWFTFPLRLRSLFRWAQADQELDDELRDHLERKTEEYVANGMAPEEAERRARLDLGGIEQTKERCRDARRVNWIQDFVQDLHYGARTLGRSPGFTLVAALTLALGIGANAAVFSVVESVLLRPLAFENSERLFAIWAVENGLQGRIGASMPEFEDYKGQSHSFEYMANFLPGWTYTWTGQGEPRTVNCTGISYDFFPMLGIKPYLGRLYDREEYHVDGVQVVISYRFWKDQLGSDSHVIGRVLNLDGTAQTVIGVMPPVADLFPETDVWAKDIPDFQWMRIRGNKFLNVFGRLKPGVTREQAEQDLTAILHRGPGESPEVSVQLVPLKAELTGDVRSELQIVMAAVSLVLLIACTNVAYLLVSRIQKRQAEIAVRVSLGASKGRLTRQFITENLVLAALGGVAALILAVGGVRLFERVSTLPRSASIGVDLYAMLFAAFITLLTGLLLALASSSASAKFEVVTRLKTARQGTGSITGPRSRLLLVAEICSAVVLSVAAGLLLRSFERAEHLDPGFLPDHLLTTYLRNNDWRDGRLFFPELLEQTAALPGVSAAALGKCMPGVYAPSAALTFADRPNDPLKVPTAEACWISSDFFKAIGARLERGRFFSRRDDANAPPVVIVNQALAESYWPGQNPIGKQIAVDYVGAGRNTTGAPRFREVVGIVRNVKQKGLDWPAEPALYTPYLQDETNHAFAGFNLLVRTIGPPTSIAGTVRAVVHSLRPDQPIDVIETMNDALFRTLAPRRLSLVLVGSFAALALVLSAIGIFGMIAYAVSQRAHEFGVRMALGAERRDIVWLVLDEGFKIVTTGVVAGIVASFALTRFMRSMLYGVGPNDPLTFALVAALFALVALAACYLPARRATHVDPMVALRYE